jgi:hypothetical protein
MPFRERFSFRTEANADINYYQASRMTNSVIVRIKENKKSRHCVRK